MNIASEPIGSIPPTPALIEAIDARRDGAAPVLEHLYRAAVRATIERLEATGSPVITISRSRDTAFAKIRTLALGTAVAARVLLSR